jgi:hypothetical protein
MLVQQARRQMLDCGTYVKKPARQEPVKAVCFPEASCYVVNIIAGDDEAGICLLHCSRQEETCLSVFIEKIQLGPGSCSSKAKATKKRVEISETLVYACVF